MTLTHTPNRKARTILAWTGIGLLAAVFLFVGAGKLTGAMDETLDGLGVPAWAIPVIGIIEIAGGALLVAPRTRFYGAVALGTTMIGAMATHLVNADWTGLPPSVVLGALTAAVAWNYRPEWIQERLPRGASA